MQTQYVGVPPSFEAVVAFGGHGSHALVEVFRKCDASHVHSPLMRTASAKREVRVTTPFLRGRFRKAETASPANVTKEATWSFALGSAPGVHSSHSNIPGAELFVSAGQVSHSVAEVLLKNLTARGRSETREEWPRRSSNEGLFYFDRLPTLGPIR